MVPMAKSMAITTGTVGMDMAVAVMGVAVMGGAGACLPRVNCDCCCWA
jgi:hypothetical protein